MRVLRGERNIFRKSAGFKIRPFNGLNYVVARGALAYFASTLAGYHDEQKADYLSHNIEPMIGYVITKHKPTFEVPIAAFPGGSQGILVESRLVFPASSGIALRNVRPDGSDRTIELVR